MLHMTENHGDNSLEGIIVNTNLVRNILESERLKELTENRNKLMMYLNNIKDWEARQEIKFAIQELDVMIDVEILNIKKEK